MKISSITTFGVVFTVFSITTVGSAEAASLYSIRDLGTLSGDNLSQAYAVNPLGQVVGYSEPTAINPPPSEPFIWDSTNGMRALALGNGADYGYSNGINSSGQAVGLSANFDPTGTGAGALWNTPTSAAQILPTLAGGSFSQAIDINNSSRIIGFSSFTSNAFLTNAVTWSSSDNYSTVQNLGTLDNGGFSRAININNNNQISGFSGNANGTTTAVRWNSPDSASIQALNPLDNNVSGAFSRGFGINDAGMVSGLSSGISTDTRKRAVMWNSNGNITDLGIVSNGSTINDQASRALSINNFGQVVGQSCATDLTADSQLLCPSTSDSRAFLWESGQLNNLDDLIVGNSGFHTLNAFGINDAGQIVGQALINGERHAYLATPVPFEPSSTLGLLMLGGLSGMGWIKNQLKGQKKALLK